MKHRRIRYGGPRQPKTQKPSFDTPVEILSLSLDGRGVARPQGKTLFVRNALPGEQVEVEIEQSAKRFDEARLATLLTASEERTTPACRYYGQCGGCDLQHLQTDAAVRMKEQELITQLAKRAKLEPQSVDAALTGAKSLGYRRATRIGINQRENGEVLLGFRRRSSAKLIDIDHCPVLTPKINDFLTEFRATLVPFNRIKHLTQIEIIEGDQGLVVELRSTKNLSDELRIAITQLAERLEVDLSLSIKEGDTVRLVENTGANQLTLTDNLKLNFSSGDFVQVNADVNEQMIRQVLQWLQPQSNERALDLFSGLGNFSLPIAQRVKQLTAVEGSPEMVERCLANAAQNAISNIQAYSADLSKPDPRSPWRQQHYDIILLDPPRQGAAEILASLAPLSARAVVYISCDPASLVRDAAALAAQGYQMSRLCVADMFPQTHHIESLALFEKV